MKIAIIGGKLQGVEAAYLAGKAGWDTILIDRCPDVPASGLSDIHKQLDISDTCSFTAAVKGVDLIIPATENRETLEILKEWKIESSIPVIYDDHAFGISSSKLKSDALFSRNSIPLPELWPLCGFPIIAKPSGGSGSEGVRIIKDQRQLERSFPSPLQPEGWILQEYLEGPAYSLEVVGNPGNYQVIQVTDLEMDAGYDCKRVTAPTVLSAKLQNRFADISINIAEALQLQGIMDVEVILHNGQLKVLEIDARLPSQTPTVVYHSSGYNILEMLNRTKTVNNTGSIHKNRLLSPDTGSGQKGVIYEHIKVTPGEIEVCGEHIMAGAGQLHLSEDFFGADEAVTNYIHGRDEWVATLIITGSGHKDVWAKRQQVIDEIRTRFKLNLYSDPIPDIVVED